MTVENYVKCVEKTATDSIPTIKNDNVYEKTKINDSNDDMHDNNNIQKANNSNIDDEVRKNRFKIKLRMWKVTMFMNL